MNQSLLTRIEEILFTFWMQDDLERKSESAAAILALIEADREALAKKVEVLAEKNKKATCKEHREPYDCGNLHIGYEEALSDVRDLLRTSPTDV